MNRYFGNDAQSSEMAAWLHGHPLVTRTTCYEDICGEEITTWCNVCDSVWRGLLSARQWSLMNVPSLPVKPQETNSKEIN